MLLSNPAKFFLVAFWFLLICTSCRFWQNGENKPVPLLSDIKSDVPFSTTEPLNFQAEIVIIASGTERKIFVARKSELRRIDYDYGQPNQHSVLETDKRYVLALRQKIYAELLKAEGDSGLSDPLTEQLLNLRQYAKFEGLGAENNLEKYRIKVGDSDTAEIMIYVDKISGMPVKQEFYSINGEERTLQYSFEMRDLRLEADDVLFQFPSGFRIVPIDEFYRIINLGK
jgi:outer membrane lipoprotein-sorting protein